MGPCSHPKFPHLGPISGPRSPWGRGVERGLGGPWRPWGQGLILQDCPVAMSRKVGQGSLPTGQQRALARVYIEVVLIGQRQP